MDVSNTSQLAGLASLQLTLMLALGFSWAGVLRHTVNEPLKQQIILGLMMGGGAVLGMLATLDLSVNPDMHPVIITLGTAFGGPLIGGIAAVITLSAHVLINGQLSLAILVYIGIALGVGLWCYRVYGAHLRDQPWPMFLAVGVMIAVSVLFSLLVLEPVHRTPDVFPLVSGFILLAYPLSTVMMGNLIARELRRYHIDTLMSREYDILQTTLASILMPVAITRVRDSHFLYANRALCDLLKIPCENIHRQKASIFYANPEERAGLMQSLQQTGSVTGYELTLYRADGVKIETLVNMQHIVFDGEPALVSSLTDMTQRKRDAQAAFDVTMQRERIRMITEVIQNISHDVNTPLSTMQTSLYLLERATDPERRQRHLHTISEQIERLTRIHEQLFEMARVDHTATYKEQPVALDSLLRTVHDRVARKAEGRKISLSMQMDDLPSTGAILGDQYQLAQALLHIVENALHYTPECGKVTLHAQVTASDVPQAVITIQDTGPGISADHLPHIFERFYRVDNARRTDTGGAGLGLSIALKIVEDHNGSIEAASVRGEGCTFTVRLPYADEPVSLDMKAHMPGNLMRVMG